MKVRIIKNRNHFDVFVNGHFYCSADSLEEAQMDAGQTENNDLYADADSLLSDLALEQTEQM